MAEEAMSMSMLMSMLLLMAMAMAMATPLPGTRSGSHMRRKIHYSQVMGEVLLNYF